MQGWHELIQQHSLTAADIVLAVHSTTPVTNAMSTSASVWLSTVGLSNRSISVRSCPPRTHLSPWESRRSPSHSSMVYRNCAMSHLG